MSNKIDYFPKYNQLHWYEKIFLNTCCYFPPIPRRTRGVDIDLDLLKYESTFENAFGKKNIKDFDNKTILDFGCGEGGFAVALANRCKKSQIVGIDLVEGIDAAIKIKSEKKLDNLDFIIGRSEVIQDNTYDYVFSHDSFEHFEDPKYILSEMIRLTKPGGFVLIKFGPTWAGPYGRHIGGTIRKDRPWIHLLVPEKVIMRVHSVYHNNEILHEKYKYLVGGLNKMTVKKAFRIVKSFKNIEIVEKKVTYIWKGKIFRNIPVLNELFSGSVYVKIKK
jgi:ubiquinone/menaquinone biosynthesis C-methylase UbiE